MHRPTASAASLGSRRTCDGVGGGGGGFRAEQAEVRGIFGGEGGGALETPGRLARRGIEGANYVAGNNVRLVAG